jgi:hypothetical protein
MKNREDIITGMCYTYRHDYGLTVTEDEKTANVLDAGMTKTEQTALWNQMAQLFDNDIAPFLQFKE